MLLSILAIHSSQLWAQANPPDTSIAPAAPEPRHEDAIIITGSRIPRINLVAPSPVTVIDSQEVKYRGTIAVEELLNELPQVLPNQGLFVSNSATGTAAVDLRGLGDSRTLVLINGRRMGPGDPTRPNPDLNLIPATLVKRVEVLTGGASSVYGSDAVSGVVNFILDTKLDGIRVDGQASFFQHKNGSTPVRAALDAAGISAPSGNTVDGGRQNFDIAIGKSLFDGRAQVTLYGGYRQVSPLTQERRDYSACTVQINDDDPNVMECGGSGASFPGNFVTFFDIFQIGPDRTFVPGISFFNFGPWNFYQRSDKRWTGGGFAEVDISDAIRPYAEVMYMRDRSVAQVAPSASFGSIGNINCDNPLLSQQQLDLVCFDGNFVGQTPIFDNDGNLVEILGTPRSVINPLTGQPYLRGFLNIARRGVDTGPRQEDIKHRNLRLVGGAKGDLGRAISYDASYLRTRAKLSVAHLNDYSVTRLRRSVDVVVDPDSGQPACRSALIAREFGTDAPGADPECVPWDIFALGAVTPEAANYLNVPSFRQGVVKERVGNVNATIDFGKWGLRSPWSNENPSINIGGEYRKDTLNYEPDERAQSGDLAGSPQDFPVHGSTSVKELFAEARIPLVTEGFIHGATFEGGYRHSWYTNDQSKFSTDAYKVALDLIPVRGLRLRGSQQRAVRAPNLVELFSPPILDFFVFDRCAGAEPDATQAQCANTGVTPEQYGHIVAIPEDSFDAYRSVIGGNVNLQPEIATTRTLGLVLEPRFLRGFNATVDWWDIELRGAIQQIGSQTIMDTCVETGDPFFCGRIHRDPDGSLWLSEEGFIDDTLANIGSLKVRGVDVGVNYQRPLGRLGSANLGFLGTYVDQWRIDNAGLSEPFDCAGKYGGDCAALVPRWRHKARFTWSTRANVSLSLNWRYTASMKLVPFVDTPESRLTAKLPSRSYFDLSSLVTLQNRYVLRMGVNNIFDKKPPLAIVGNGACTALCNGNTFSHYYDPLGRFFFAGVTVDLKPF